MEKEEATIHVNTTSYMYIHAKSPAEIEFEINKLHDSNMANMYWYYSAYDI